MIERDEEGSRLKIIGMLTLAEDWITAKQALGECTSSGPWSEDLQALVIEGVVECSDSIEEMHNGSMVRLRI